MAPSLDGRGPRSPASTRWWPHTHGAPALSDVRLEAEDRDDGAATIDLGRVGFRTICRRSAADHDIERDGLFVHVNGVPVFARGALWTPLDVVDLARHEPELRDGPARRSGPPG